MNQEQSIVDMPVVEPELDAIATTAPKAWPKVPARLIEYAQGCYIALPPHTTYALIEEPEVLPVPGSARYAYGLLDWQGSRLPLIDLDALLRASPNAMLAAAPRYALVVAYQCIARGPLAYGALGLQTLPQTIAIGDDAQCALPTDSKLWPLLSLSCFQHEGQAVPIFDLATLFSAYHS